MFVNYQDLKVLKHNLNPMPYNLDLANGSKDHSSHILIFSVA